MNASHAATRRRLATDPEYVAHFRKRSRERRAKYRAADPERERARDREWKANRWANDPEWRARQLHNRKALLYGLTREALQELIDAHAGACGICGDTDVKLHVDHDHRCCNRRGSCGQCVRGLICEQCNNGLGRFRDNPKALRAAAEYLERYR